MARPMTDCRWLARESFAAVWVEVTDDDDREDGLRFFHADVAMGKAWDLGDVAVNELRVCARDEPGPRAVHWWADLMDQSEAGLPDLIHRWGWAATVQEAQAAAVEALCSIGARAGVPLQQAAAVLERRGGVR